MFNSREQSILDHLTVDNSFKDFSTLRGKNYILQPSPVFPTQRVIHGVFQKSIGGALLPLNQVI